MKVELAVDLVVEVVARAADALTERVAALDHEARDDAVEDDVLVERALAGLAGGGVGPLAGAVGEADEVLDRAGSVVSEEVDDDVAVVGVQGGDSGVRSACATFSQSSVQPLPSRAPSGKMGRTTSPVDREGPVSLSRKRKKELRKLQAQANNLWETQQVLVGEAASVAREAGRQLGHFSREQVVPQVQESYGRYAGPVRRQGRHGLASRS